MNVSALSDEQVYQAGVTDGYCDGRLLALWDKCIEAMAHPSFEMTCEEFAQLYSLFRRLQYRGVEFDPALTVLMYVLRDQVPHLDAGVEDDTDSDEDNSDAGTDNSIVPMATYRPDGERRGYKPWLEQRRGLDW